MARLIFEFKIGEQIIYIKIELFCNHKKKKNDTRTNKNKQEQWIKKQKWPN
jgi:hypothetical protein